MVANVILAYEMDEPTPNESDSEKILKPCEQWDLLENGHDDDAALFGLVAQEVNANERLPLPFLHAIQAITA